MATSIRKSCMKLSILSINLFVCEVELESTIIRDSTLEFVFLFCRHVFGGAELFAEMKIFAMIDLRKRNLFVKSTMIDFSGEFCGRPELMIDSLEEARIND